MSALAPKTVDRMRATLAPSMDVDVAGRQRLRISEELRTVPVAVSVSRRSRPGLTPRVAGLVAIVVLMVVAGSGVASQAAIPGDLLYPVKRLTEPLLAVFDDDLAATRRVDELVVIIADIDRADRVDRAIIDARDAVDGLASDHPLRVELDRIVDRTPDRLNIDVVPDDAERDATPSKDVGSQDTDDGRQPRDDTDTSRGGSDGGRDTDPNHQQEPPSTTVPPQRDLPDPPPENRAGDEPPPDDGQSEHSGSTDPGGSTGRDEPPADLDR